MPFVNSAQRRACYYQEQNALSKGETPKWNCKKMGKLYYSGRLRTVYVTARGAHFVKVNNKKIYVYGIF